MTRSPFGRYSDLVTSLVTVFLVVAVVLQHWLSPETPATFLDAAALLAIGATYGKQSAANGYAAEARAAHKRLDKLGAPPADDGQD